MAKKIKYRGDKKEQIKKEKQDRETLEELELLDRGSDEKVDAFYKERLDKEAKVKQKEYEKALNTADWLSKKWNYDQFIVERANELIGNIISEAGEGFRGTCIRSRHGYPIQLFGESISGSYSEDGVVFCINYKGKNYVKAMRLSRDAIIDVGALRTMMVLIENTIDSLKGNLESEKERIERETGLILP